MMIGNALWSPGFLGLGDGDDRGARVDPDPSLEAVRQGLAHSVWPDDSFVEEDACETAVHDFEVAFHGAARGVGTRDLLLSGLAPHPPLPETHARGARADLDPIRQMSRQAIEDRLSRVIRLLPEDLLQLAYIRQGPRGSALDVTPLLYHGGRNPSLLDVREDLDPAPPASLARLTGAAQFLNKLLDTWRLDHDAALALLGLEPSQRNYLDDLLTGYAPPAGRDIKDRIAYLFTIRKTLSGLFQDEAVENDWLREAHALLEGRKPMTLMLEGSMDNLLLVKEYVDTAAGQ